MINADGLGKIVIGETVDCGEALITVGQMMAYTAEPIAVIRLPNGQTANWEARWVRLATPTEIAIVQSLAPAQNECLHDKNTCGRITRTLLLCGRCRKAVEE